MDDKILDRLRVVANDVKNYDDRLITLGSDVGELLTEYERINALTKSLRRRVVVRLNGTVYHIPEDRRRDWDAFIANREVGEFTSVVPLWAELLQKNAVIAVF